MMKRCLRRGQTGRFSPYTTLLLLLFLAACSEPEPTPTANPTATPVVTTVAAATATTALPTATLSTITNVACDPAVVEEAFLYADVLPSYSQTVTALPIDGVIGTRVEATFVNQPERAIAYRIVDESDNSVPLDFLFVADDLYLADGTGYQVVERDLLETIEMTTLEARLFDGAVAARLINATCAGQLETLGSGDVYLYEYTSIDLTGVEPLVSAYGLDGTVPVTATGRLLIQTINGFRVPTLFSLTLAWNDAERQQVGVTFISEVGGVGEDYLIEPPTDVVVPTFGVADLPLPPDANVVAVDTGVLAFTTGVVPAGVLIFFAAELPPLGWVETSQDVLEEDEVEFLIVNYVRGDEQLTIGAGERETGRTVVSMVLGPVTDDVGE